MLKKVGLISFFFLLYFIAIIPLRNYSMIEYKNKTKEKASPQVVFVTEAARALSVSFEKDSKIYVARIPFGMNFFIGIIGLIIISATKKFYFIEIGVQILFGLIIIVSFLYGIKGNVAFLRISDMASVYFLPLSSLFMVVLAFIEKKMLKMKSGNEN